MQAVTKNGLRKHRTLDGDVCEPQDESPEAASEPASEPSAEDDGEYTWLLTVANPCLYLDDQAWHLANLRMAARKAEEAGRKPTGEGRYVGETASTDRSVTLTYRVPVAN